MTRAFWIAAFVVFYTYVGYPLILCLVAKLKPQAVLRAELTPTVSVVIAAYNESANLPRKIANLKRLDYPAEKLEMIIVSDGSDDETSQILGGASGERVKTVCLKEHDGKAVALNCAVKYATGEVLIFTDARQELDAASIRSLVRNFTDPQVGCVSGELILKSSNAAVSDGLGLYWRIEKKVRELESRSGSVVGATGAIYAMRRELFVRMPRGVILDDVYEPMNVIKQGFRVVFDPSARAFDQLSTNASAEFTRKVRTLMGNYQLVRLSPWTIGWKNPILFKFISHKLLRLLVPVALITVFLAAALATGPIYKSLFLAQLLVYGLGLLPTANRFGLVGRVAGVVRSFILLNAAAGMAMANVLLKRSAGWR